MRQRPVGKTRPVSEDMTDKAPILNQRRLSGISEERARRKSLPPEMLKEDLAQFDHYKQEQHRELI